jgi:acetyl-CoA carboxylase biotin carboxyl carrier protein
MDIRKIKKLIELLEESGITELEIREADEAIRISRPAPGVAAALPEVRPAAAGVPETPAPKKGAVEELDGFVVRSPLVGTFYRAPAPGEQPFVKPGQSVGVGDVLCIIESMKMMNRIESERAGIVKAILLEDAQPVEAQEPILVIG